MKISEKKNRRFTVAISRESINSALLLMSVIIAVTPELNRNFPKVVWMMIVVLWYINSFIFHKHSDYKGKYFALLLFLWFLWDLFLKVIGVSTAKIGNYFILFVFYDILVKSMYTAQYYTDEMKSKLIRIIQVVIIINVIINIYQGIQNPEVHFLYYFYPENYVGMDIAMTEFYNMLSFFVGFCIYDLLQQRKKGLKFFDLGCTLISLYFMLSFEARSTALVVTILLVVVVLFSYTKSIKARALEVIISIMLLLFVVISFSGIVSFISPYLPERVALRLVSFSQGGNFQTSEYLERFRLVNNSIRTFFSSLPNFLFGIGYHLGEEYKSVVGQHSLITDYLARYGCIGLVFLVVFFRGIRKRVLGFSGNDIYHRYCNSVVSVFFIASILSNTFRAETAITSFLLLSLSSNSLKEGA